MGRIQKKKKEIISMINGRFCVFVGEVFSAMAHPTVGYSMY